MLVVVGRFRIGVFEPILVRCRECNPLCAVGEDSWVEMAGGRQGVLTPLFPPSQSRPKNGVKLTRTWVLWGYETGSVIRW